MIQCSMEENWVKFLHLSYPCGEGNEELEKRRVKHEAFKKHMHQTRRANGLKFQTNVERKGRTRRTRCPGFYTSIILYAMQQ